MGFLSVGLMIYTAITTLKGCPMIYDTFTFFNEIDLLKIRLEELQGVVDKFVLVESIHTHAYREKPLYFQEYKHEFKDYLDKIVYYLVEDTPPMGKFDRWAIERHQRGCISRALDKCNCSNDDVILISDLDEIPRASKIEMAKNLLLENDFVIFDQKFYIRYLNCIHQDSFCGTVACKYGTLREYGSVNDIRWGWGNARKRSTTQRAGIIAKASDKNYPHILNGGWHFTSFGGYDAALYKSQNYGHKEFDKSLSRGINYISYNIGRSNIQNNKKSASMYKNLEPQVHEDYRNFREIPLNNEENFPVDSDLPEYLKINKRKYMHFFKFAIPYYDGHVEIKFFNRLYYIKMLFNSTWSCLFRLLRNIKNLITSH